MWVPAWSVPVESGRLVVAPVTVVRVPKRLPSRMSWTVPVGVGVEGETEAATVTAVPWTTVEGETVRLVVLGLLVWLMVRGWEAEVEAW
jgi:hypothetical protein